MYYKCENCENVFEDGEESGFRCSIEFRENDIIFKNRAVCPCCESNNVLNAVKCKQCGKILIEDETKDGFCEECVRKMVLRYKYDISKCYNISKKTKETEGVNINAFLATMFTETQINEILYRELATASAFAPVDCTRFIKSAKGWFVDAVVEEVIKNDNR